MQLAMPDPSGKDEPNGMATQQARTASNSIYAEQGRYSSTLVLISYKNYLFYKKYGVISHTSGSQSMP